MTLCPGLRLGGRPASDLELILVLLAVAVALQVLAGRFGIPQPALLVLGGAALDALRHRHERRARRWESRERRLGREPPIGRHDPNPGDDGGGEAEALSHRRLRGAMIDAERRAGVELRDRGVIGADVLRRLGRDLDLEAMLLGYPPPEPPRSGEHRDASAAPSDE